MTDTTLTDPHTFRSAPEDVSVGAPNVTITVLSLCDWYLPGFKAGGPIRSVSSMTTLLTEGWRFLVLTRDRDRGDREPYDGVADAEWRTVSSAQVKYLAPREYGWLGLRTFVRTLRAIDYDVIYLNSFFSFSFSIVVVLLRRLGLIRRTPIVIAPRGELAPAAIMSRSRRKKRVYVSVARLTRLYQDVLWHASTEHEAKEITDVFATGELHIARDLATRVHVARNLAAHPSAHATTGSRAKKAGELRIVFLSRIARKKNLLFGLNVLLRARGNIVLDIYGPVEDQRYWAECEAAMAAMPVNIVVNYRGAIEPAAIEAVLRSYHLYFFPTLNENFGHTILEALLAGCVILTSTQTPWRDLEAHDVGWDLALDRPGEFLMAIARCVEMSHDEFARMSGNAVNFGRSKSWDEEALESNKQLFWRALKGM